MPVQRVRRVIRKVDPWTVLKASLIFNAIMGIVFVLGSVIFWSVFVNAGLPERIDELALLIGIENGITLDGPVYFRVVVLLAVVGSIMLTGFFTLAAVVYNLISDLVGGVEVVMLEETKPAVAPSRPRIDLPAVDRKPDAGEKERASKVSLPNVEAIRRVKDGGSAGSGTEEIPRRRTPPQRKTGT